MVVHFPPDSLEADKLAELNALCESSLDELTDLFGFALRRRLVVYILASCQDMDSVFGRKMGGTGMYLANAISHPRRLSRS